MTLRIGINGFGRIGRLIARVAATHPEIQIAGINDLTTADNLAYLFKYDSTHGVFKGSVLARPEEISINQEPIPCFSKANPAELPWQELQVDYVADCTGKFTSYKGASQHLKAGAKRVILSAPTKDPDQIPTFVMGINEQLFNPETDQIVSNASCTTNGLAPIAKVLNQTFGICEGLMTTVHAMTPSQATIDQPNSKDWRRGRGASQSIIPASTGAAKAIALVMPELKGKLSGMAFRVNMPDVSAIDLTFRTEKATSYHEICQAMKQASEGELKGILDYTEDPVVSVDFLTNSHSSIFDAKSGLELNCNFFKVVAWYDNEWGYACRIIDLILSMAKQEGILPNS